MVTIITPTYNHEAFIAECIESVLAQTYQDWEMLIVNDGSTDGTWSVVQEYAAGEGRIRPIAQTNRGIWRLAETYNLALRNARGGLIAILEGDDLWPPRKLEKEVASLSSAPNVVLAHGRTSILRGGSVVGDYCSPPREGVVSAHEYLRWILLREACIMPVSVMIRKQALIDVGGFSQADGLPAVDYTTWLRLFRRGGQVVWLKENLGIWRQSQHQVTRTMGEDLAHAALRAAIDCWLELKDARDVDLGLSKRKVMRAQYRKVISPMLLSQMRVALVEGRKDEALRHAARLVAHGSLLRKMQGVYGAMMAWLGLDAESLFRAVASIVGTKSN